MGTAYFASSRIWFTLAAGIVSELYSPTIDRPQTRDLQYLISDGETFFHDERRHTTWQLEQLSEHSLGFRVINTNEEKGYRIVKQIITDPHYPCLLVHTRLEAEPSVLEKLNLYALLAPHLDGGGWGNSGLVDSVAGHDLLLAHKNGLWLALGASIPFSRRSVGYVGASDGWTDLDKHKRMEWEFEQADDGNIALTGQLDLAHGHEFTLAVALGSTRHHAVTTLEQSLATPFADHRARFIEQWQRTCGHVVPGCMVIGDHGALYRRSHSLILAHEDKTYPGATIASLSIPWGESKGDEDLGGYHLVWPRDMVHSVTALLATGNTATPYRSLVYLASSQAKNGGFYQNFWIDGDPYWTGVQLDQVSFAILLAWRVKQAGAPTTIRSLPDGVARGGISGSRRTGHGAGALGRKQRLLPFHAGGEHRGPVLRGANGRGARRPDGCQLLVRLCRLFGIEDRSVDRNDGEHPGAGHLQALYPDLAGRRQRSHAV